MSFRPLGPCSQEFECDLAISIKLGGVFRPKFRQVLSVEENQELEAEEDVKEHDPEDYDEFQRRMKENNIRLGSDVWRLLWKEKAESRAHGVARDQGGGAG